MASLEGGGCGKAYPALNLRHILTLFFQRVESGPNDCNVGATYGCLATSTKNVIRRADFSLLLIITRYNTVFRFPTTVASKFVLGRETVWVTLRERPPPTPVAALFAANRLKPRKRNFDTVGRTGLFVEALKAGDWTEATMMLSSAAKLQMGKVKATGAADGERRRLTVWAGVGQRRAGVLGLLCLVDGGAASTTDESGTVVDPSLVAGIHG